MNKTDWKTDDPVWVQNQERKWRYFERSLIRSTDEDDPDELKRLASNLELGKEYALGKITELPKRGERYSMRFNFIDWVLLHPNPTEENIGKIKEDFIEKGFAERLPYAIQALDIAGFCQDLRRTCDIPSSIVDAYMNVIYGDSFQDILKKNEIDFEEKSTDMIATYIGKVTSWHTRGMAADPENLVNIDRWIKYLKDMLLLLDDEHIVASTFSMKRFFLKFLNNFEGKLDGDTESFRLDSIPRNCEIIADLRNEVITQKSNYCPKLQDYVNQLEAKLIEDNKI